MVTVGIVFFNCERYLRDAINSVFKQSFSDWKLILINDGSTDGSVLIAEEFVYDERVRLYNDGKNLGLTCRLNFLADICDTEFLCRMDADDIMHFDRLRTQLQVLKENAQIDVLGTNAFIINEKNQVVALREKYSSHDLLLNVNSLIHPSVMARSVWFKNNRYDEKFENRIQDLELWFRVRNKSTLVYLSKPLLFYREIEGDYSSKYKNGLREMMYFITKHWSKYSAHIIFIKYLTATILYQTKLSSLLLKKRNSLEFDILNDYSECNN